MRNLMWQFWEKKGKWYDHKVSVKNPVKTGDVEETTDDTDKRDSSDKENQKKQMFQR